MQYKTGSVELAEDELVDDMKSLGMEIPSACDFPFSYKLDEKFTASFAKKGYVLRSNKFVPAFSRSITKNQVVQLEKGD